MHLNVEVLFLSSSTKINIGPLMPQKRDNSLGCLINHSQKLQNCKPIVGEDRGKPFVYFIATSDILPDNEILYDYGDNSKMSTKYFPWLRD